MLQTTIQEFVSQILNPTPRSQNLKFGTVFLNLQSNSYEKNDVVNTLELMILKGSLFQKLDDVLV